VHKPAKRGRGVRQTNWHSGNLEQTTTGAEGGAFLSTCNGVQKGPKELGNVMEFELTGRCFR